ncbi:MAG TPA: hypothetical protein VGK53_11620 [Propionicimonas sp.]
MSGSLVDDHFGEHVEGSVQTEVQMTPLEISQGRVALGVVHETGTEFLGAPTASAPRMVHRARP